MATQEILDKKTRDLVERYLSNVRAAGIEVIEAFVFGSHATGRADKHSDIDLAVVSPDFGKDQHEELVRLFKLVDVETRTVEPVPFSLEGLEDRYNPLAAEVRRYGVAVHL